MNNDQFRRLVLDTPTNKPSSSSNARTTHATNQGGRTPSAALGSRVRSSIPMTPRAVNNTRTSLHNEFARQLAEQQQQQQQPAAKRFKSSAAPKGTRLPSGYQDRAALLREGGEGSEKKLGDEEEDGAAATTKTGEELETRVKALEEMVKLGQIDQGTFEKLIREMGVGGDLGSTHMVKGLDWELLRRVRRGEDVTRAEGKGDHGGEDEDKAGDVDDELDKVLGEEEGGVGALPSAPREQKVKKKGVMAPPPPPPSQVPRSRDEILRQLKASRAAAAAAAAQAEAEEQQQQPVEPALGERFKRIGGESKVEKKRWIEQDETGRRKEILQITDAQGKVKRKVRWLDKPGEAPAPAPAAKPLGMEVPVEFAAKAAAAPAEEDDDDIFAGVGADYNPLAELGDEDDSSSSDESGDEAAQKKPIQRRDTAATATAETSATVEDTAGRPRNYFSTPTTDEVPEIDRSNPLAKDATLLAALKRAAALRQSEEAAGEGEEDVDAETALRRQKFLEEARRREALDAMDLDMGFGGSRVGDEEDDEEVVLEGEGRGGKKRKRGPKKKKGDKNSASDVLRVMEGRKQGQ
ncbi:uncharacterized protein BP01DRAFT_426396 [Aspergillus saccharolyticus JOP 1030-1]|uniref:RED-like N-terminal domain-containing protein n=1 Tax=Aspergillus saccharolyticus JOP 1030-1 TaxID=1450539 RepID=A0A318ZD68_9EURO|nr:hypothetical protein BP01DRAFT_426396 [Aspergillus saccharolyticus JOP 1030-1]PYH41460.1 hypothetical protein BP01DRAFT_426396 [Aspergillus saccharolyticus JOP 1030-1]